MEPQILRRFLVLWASRIVLKTAITSNESLKNKFREAERTSIKLIETESHRSFNECCLIYIYIYPAYVNTYMGNFVHLLKLGLGNQVQRGYCPDHGYLINDNIS